MPNEPRWNMIWDTAAVLPTFVVDTEQPARAPCPSCGYNNVLVTQDGVLLPVQRCRNCSRFWDINGGLQPEPEDPEARTAARAARAAEQRRYQAEAVARRDADNLRAIRATPTRIFNYTFKPPPVFKGRSSIGLYYGLENEVEVEEGMRLATVAAHIVRAAPPDLLYFKQDGTLRNGLELVTHPMSFTYFDQRFPVGVMDVLARDGRNWAGRPKEFTCGLHVHMSRNAFGKKGAVGKERPVTAGAYHLYKFVQFVYTFPALVQFVAGREGAVLRGAEMCSYNKRLLGARGAFDHQLKDYVLSTDAQIKDIAHGKATHPDRHMAVNLKNETTVEMRMFRGTTNYKRLRAAVQFCDALFFYSLTHHLHHRDPAKQMSEEGFKAFAATRPIRYADLLRVFANDPAWGC